MTYHSSLTNLEAVYEWETFGEQLQRDFLEWYDYWMVIDMRESFDNGERTLTEDQWEIVKKTDEIIRAKLLSVMAKFDRIPEYISLGKHRPKEFWWWHLLE